MSVAVQHHYQLKGDRFGVRECTCGCQPCDCNPCRCQQQQGDTQPRYPQWRVSGYHITNGTIEGRDVSQRLLLSLARPAQQGNNNTWQEVLLVDAQATPEQIEALLEVLEDRLESLPAEIQTPFVRQQRAVYKVSVTYQPQDTQPHVRVVFQPEQANLFRAGTQSTPMPTAGWSYDGPMVVREIFDVHH